MTFLQWTINVENIIKLNNKNRKVDTFYTNKPNNTKYPEPRPRHERNQTTLVTYFIQEPFFPQFC